MKKKILIFGNLGYVGSKLSEVLNYKKFETYGVDIGLFENCAFYKNFERDITMIIFIFSYTTRNINSLI